MFITLVITRPEVLHIKCSAPFCIQDSSLLVAHEPHAQFRHPHHPTTEPHHLTSELSFSPPYGEKNTSNSRFHYPIMLLKKITSLPIHSDRVWQARPHPTLPLLATASGDRSTQILSLRTYTPVTSLDNGHKRSIRSIAWHPTAPNPVLATGSFDATCGIWRHYPSDDPESPFSNDAEYDFAVVLDGHESEIKSVAWSAGGTFLATCSRDKSVWVWEELDDDNFETVAVLQEHTQDVKCVTWHPEEVLLASSSYDDTIRLYKEDVDDWECCAVLEGHEGTVWCVQFEPKEDSKRLVSCSDDLSVRIWVRVDKYDGDKERPLSILRGEPVREDWVQQIVLPKAHERSIYAVNWSPVSGRIVTCGGDGKIVVYEEISREENVEAAPAGGSGESNSDAEGLEDGEKGKEDTTWKVIAELENAHGVFEVNHVTWSRRFDKGETGSSEEIIISCGDDGSVNVWSLEKD